MRKRILYWIGAKIVCAVGLIISFPVIGIADGNGPSPSPPFLDNLPPTWSQKIPVDQRFVPVLDGEAVLDKETGLVWQQTIYNDLWDWNGARAQCNVEEFGGRMGWHLPSVEQLASLIDRTSEGRKLPEGHPFEGVRTKYPYWTSTPYPGAYGFVFEVDFATGEIGGADMYATDRHVWCVRGGQTYDNY